jgi:acyl carrier protein
MPSYDEVLNKLGQMLQAHVRGTAAIHEEMVLTADLELDSAQLMELVLEIEEEFDISVPLNILPDVQTVRDLALQLHAILEQSA